MPVNSYPPEMLKFFVLAANDTITIPCVSEAQAIRLRYKLYHLRKLMIEEEHPYATIANSVVIRVKTSNEGKFAVVGDAEVEFTDLLRDAGVTVDESEEEQYALAFKEVKDDLMPVEVSLPDSTDDVAQAISNFLKPGKE